MTSHRSDQGETYFGVAAIIILAVGGLAITGAATSTSMGSPIALWIGAVIAPATYIAAMAWCRNRVGIARLQPSVLRIALPAIALALYGSALSWVFLIGHRFSILPIALAQTFIVAQFAKSFRRPSGFAALFVATSFAWALELAIMWLPLDDFLLSGTPVEAFATIAFVLALACITVDRLATNPPLSKRGTPRYRRACAAIFATLVFLELGLRTDRLLSDWIPYHRSYFAGPAEFVRQGHWLLWDVPSQYGFLSILTVAAMPGTTSWQSLYFTTALFLVSQATLLFWILRFRRRGLLNIVVSVAICCAIFYGNQAVRAPFGAQLYPQEGVRFIWSITMLCAMFGAHVYRKRPRIARWFTFGGWASWMLSILWSFETGIMSTVAWIGYLGTESFVRLLHSKHRRYEMYRILVRQLLPLCVLPAATFAFISLYYYHFLGRYPDWSSYVEFSSLYAGGEVAEAQSVKVTLFGTGLALVAVLTGLATFAALVSLKRAYVALPLVVGCAAAAWATSIYYIAEPFNQHVNGIVCVFAFVFGIYAILARELDLGGISLGLSQAMIIPIYVMFTAQFFGEPARLLSASAPLYHYSLGAATGFPPLQGELAKLLTRTRITESDRIDLPDVLGGTKLSTGVTMPFARLHNGETVELKPWLPTTPVGALNALLTLPPPRRRQYIGRFLTSNKPFAGWLVTYAQPAKCGVISPVLENVRSFASENFSIARCAFSRTPYFRAGTMIGP